MKYVFDPNPVAGEDDADAYVCCLTRLECGNVLLKDGATMDPAEISCKMQREGANTPHVGAEQEIVAVQWCEDWKSRLKKKNQNS